MTCVTVAQIAGRSGVDGGRTVEGEGVVVGAGVVGAGEVSESVLAPRRRWFGEKTCPPWP
jgi:hypothetical protein